MSERRLPDASANWEQHLSHRHRETKLCHTRGMMGVVCCAPTLSGVAVGHFDDRVTAHALDLELMGKKKKNYKQKTNSAGE